MKRVILSLAIVCAVTAFARPPRYTHNHPTNETEVGGVKFPPKYTQAEWEERNRIYGEFNKKMREAESAIEERWYANLNKEQKDALDAERERLTKEQESARAKTIRRQWEMEAVTNRTAWVKKEFKEKRRIEREYNPGLKWMDSEIVKETITIGESGKIRIYFFYTADGKKHKFDPESIERELVRRKQSETLNAIIKED